MDTVRGDTEEARAFFCGCAPGFSSLTIFGFRFQPQVVHEAVERIKDAQTGGATVESLSHAVKGTAVVEE